MSSLSVPAYTSPRKRSSSKTQQNFHPINSTSLSDLTTFSTLDDQTSRNPDQQNNNTMISDTGVQLDLNANLGDQLSSSLKSSTTSNNESVTSSENSESSLGSSPPTEDLNDAASSKNSQRSYNKTSKQPKPLSLITDMTQKDLNNGNTPTVGQKYIPSSQQQTHNNKSILLRKPLPSEPQVIKPKLSNSGTNKQSSSSSTATHISSNTSSSIPSLKSFVHVVRLISPDQPEEYLKVLNIPILPDTLKIGRQNTPKTSNKITDGFFDSRVLSRNHAELFIKDNQLFIRDLKSSNGTFINDAKLEPYKDYKLSINDKIDLGTTLESQMAHKKITCIIKDFDYISLKNFENLVEEINNKDDLITKKMELFNNTFDALLFGEIVDDIVLGVDGSSTSDLNLNDDLLDLIMTDKKINENTSNGTTNIKLNGTSNSNSKAKAKAKNNNDTIKFVQGLDLKPSQNPQDVVKKLITAVNNEYIQQQRLKEMNIYLKNYNNSIAGYESNSVFKLYDKLLKAEREKDHSNYSNVSNNLTSTPPLSPNQKQLKYNRMEDQLRNSMAELDAVRQHLSTAKAKESKMKKIGIENEKLKKMLGSSEHKITDLEHRLKFMNETNEKNQSRVIQLQSEIEQLKKERELWKAATEKTPLEKAVEDEKPRDVVEVSTNEEDIAADKNPTIEAFALDSPKVELANEIEKEKEEESSASTVETLTENFNAEEHKDGTTNNNEKIVSDNVKHLLQELSSGFVKYGGWVLFSVVFVYYTGPDAIKKVTEIVSR